MLDMSSWDELRLDVVNGVHLDPSNVRLGIDTASPEADIIQDLFQNEKVMDLVQGIASIGYLSHETPIVVLRDRQYIVVEGNRRIAALKAIQNPYLVPAFQSRIERIVTSISDRGSLRYISFKLAPNEEQARQLIAFIHTSNPRESWSRARQVAFFDAQFNAGATLEELMSRYPTIDVKDFAHRRSMVNLFSKVSYSSKETASYLSSVRFPMTVLERLFESAEFQKTAGIRFDQATAENTVEDWDVFQRIADKVITDIQEKKINTRNLNSVKNPAFVAYIQELNDFRTQENTAESGSDPDLGAIKGQENKSPATETGNGARTNGSHRPDPVSARNDPGKVPFARPKGRLDSHGVEALPGYPALSVTLEELLTIDYRKFPNATFDLMRTYLEKTIKACVKTLKLEHEYKGARGGFISIKVCLEWLEMDIKRSGETALEAPLKLIIGEASPISYQVSQSHLNAANHNYNVAVRPESVKHTWDTMAGLLRYILERCENANRTPSP